MDELRFYKSILSTSEILDLYKYGNPNLPTNSYMILSANSVSNSNANSNSNATITYTKSILLDDDGKINNLCSRPLPYTILSGEIIAYLDNASITGINTNFINEYDDAHFHRSYYANEQLILNAEKQLAFFPLI